MDEFLKVEYERCLDLLKYYDERVMSLVKFSSGLSSAILSLIFGVQHLQQQAMTPESWSLVALMCAVTALGLSALFVIVVQTRLYFIYPARQVNGIRAAMLKSVVATFSDNRMYVNPNTPAFRFRSGASFVHAFLCLQIGAFAGLTAFAVGIYRWGQGTVYFLAPLAGIVTAVVLYVVAAVYLKTSDKAQADQMIGA
jgi:hypothetical protein